MKSKMIGTLGVLFIFTLSGCSSEEKQLPDTYVDGSDYQYIYTREAADFPNIQKGENGYYLLWDNFIYFFDEEDELIVPLCSKPDCLHDKEATQEKKESCNAYASTFANTGLAYCSGSLYYVDTDNSSHFPALYQYMTDGSGREKLYEWKDEGFTPTQWIVHRDVLYYTLQSYYTDEEEIDHFLAFYALPLTGKDRLKPKQIYFPEEEGRETIVLGNPVAYGNYVYFLEAGNQKKGDEQESSYIKTYVYNIQTGEVGEIRAPGQSDDQWIGEVEFWQDKIIFLVSDFEKDNSEEGFYYIADLDGSDPKIFLKTDRPIYNIYGDGKYLYQSNVLNHVLTGDEDPKIYHVYDENLKEIDTFTTDDTFTFDFPIGNEDRAYCIYYKESGEWGIEYWDKSVIGSLNGAQIKFTAIPYEGSIQE